MADINFKGTAIITIPAQADLSPDRVTFLCNATDRLRWQCSGKQGAIRLTPDSSIFLNVLVLQALLNTEKPKWEVSRDTLLQALSSGAASGKKLSVTKARLGSDVRSSLGDQGIEFSINSLIQSGTNGYYVNPRASVMADDELTGYLAALDALAVLETLGKAAAQPATPEPGLAVSYDYVCLTPTSLNVGTWGIVSNAEASMARADVLERRLERLKQRLLNLMFTPS